MTGSLTERARHAIRRSSPWTWLVLAACALHASWMSYLQVDLHNGLGTFSYDVGLYDQGLWLLSRFKAPFVTLMGRNLFGDHASLILLPLVPLYWIVPGTPTLLVLQAWIVAAGAFPMYLLARRLLASGAAAAMIALAWLFNPAVNGTNMENFHPDSFYGLLVPIALFAVVSRKWRMYAVAVVLILLVKEDALLLVVPLGLWVAARGERRRGAVTVIAAIGASLAGMFLLMRSLTGVATRNAWRIPFGGFGGLVREIVTRPANVVSYLSDDRRPWYVWQMTLPMAGAFLASPGVAAVAVPVVASNVLSTFYYQHDIQYHYSIVAVPVLLAASVFAVSRLAPAFRTAGASVILAFSVVTFVAWGQHPLAVHPRVVLPGGAEVAVAGREIIRGLPPDAVLSVYDPLTTHLAHRKEIYFFPNPFRAVYYGVDASLSGERLPAADRVDFVVLPRVMSKDLMADWARLKDGWNEVRANSYWQVFAPITGG